MALQYHDLTKHSLASVQSSQHRLDWSNQPLPFKIYTSLPALPLPTAFAPSDPGLSATGGSVPGLLDLNLLARLCYYGNGITKVLHRPGGDTPFRAAACTGALYHIELYLVCQDLDALPAGVYHYGAHDHAHRQLRPGDLRSTLLQASGLAPNPLDASGLAADPVNARGLAPAPDAPAATESEPPPPAFLILTSTFWRNAWKYQSRAYRHSFWDSGTVLANLLAVAQAHDLPARVLAAFADAPINHLLGIDPHNEAAIALVALGAGGTPFPAAPPLEAISYPTRPLSHHEIDYPAITRAHAATSLPNAEAAATFRARAATHEGPSRSLPEVEHVITRRGSSRQFTHEPITSDQLHRMLAFAAQPIPADFAPLTTPYLIVNAVDGLAPGAYVYQAGNLHLLKPGDFRREAGFLDLGQPLAADAAVNVYTLANLPALIAQLGERAYRAAQLDGAIHGGRLYLAAYAERLGATGLTFFDDDVSNFFNVPTQAVMFLTAIGHPTRRRKL